MRSLRMHTVAVTVALLIGMVVGGVYMLLSGERGILKFLGWSFMTFLAIAYPTILAAMLSNSQDRCTLWLKRLASGGAAAPPA